MKFKAAVPVVDINNVTIHVQNSSCIVLLVKLTRDGYYDNWLPQL